MSTDNTRLLDLAQQLGKAANAIEDYALHAAAVESIPAADERKLEAAAEEQAIATFEYRKPDESQFEVRVVRVEDFAEAYDSRKHSRFRYIRAWDYDRGEYRTFRLHRIRHNSVKVAE